MGMTAFCIVVLALQQKQGSEANFDIAILLQLDTARLAT